MTGKYEPQPPATQACLACVLHGEPGIESMSGFYSRNQGLQLAEADQGQEKKSNCLWGVQTATASEGGLRDVPA